MRDKISYHDVIDALDYAQRNGASVAINPALPHESNYKALLRAGDDAGQEALKRHTFIQCECCNHES